MNYFARVVSSIRDEEESKQLIRLVRQYDYLFQVQDSINDLFESKRVINQQFIELKSDVLLSVRELSSHTLGYFDTIRLSMHGQSDGDIKKLEKELQSHINSANRDILTLLVDPARVDAGALTNFVTYSQRIKDKLHRFVSMTLSKTSSKEPIDEKSEC